MEIRRLMRRSGDCLQGVITTKENFSETLNPKSGRELLVYERLILYRFDQENVALDGLSFMGGGTLQTFTQAARYNIKRLMNGPEGNKINCFPRDQSLVIWLKIN